MPDTRKMKKVRIDMSLLEQIDWYDLFPKGTWSRQARVNYLVQVGLAVLLLKFERECKERQSEDRPVDFVEQLIRNDAVSRLLIQATGAGSARDTVSSYQADWGADWAASVKRH